jgi:hypothetical protein
MAEATNDSAAGDPAVLKLVGHLDRLCPSQVEKRDKSGHTGKLLWGPDGQLSVNIGWSGANGLTGHLIMTADRETALAVSDVLASLPDGALDNGGIKRVLAAHRAKIHWHI